jgi:hypothetical protein
MPGEWVSCAGITPGEARHAYSLAPRQRALADCDHGLRTRAGAAECRASESWGRRPEQRRRPAGAVAPRAPDAGPAPSWHAYADRLRAAVAATPDATPEGLRDRLGLAVAPSTPGRAVAAPGLAVRKKSSGRPSRTGPT